MAILYKGTWAYLDFLVSVESLVSILWDPSGQPYSTMVYLVQHVNLHNSVNTRSLKTIPYSNSLVFLFPFIEDKVWLGFLFFNLQYILFHDESHLLSMQTYFHHIYSTFCLSQFLWRSVPSPLPLRVFDTLDQSASPWLPILPQLPASRFLLVCSCYSGHPLSAPKTCVALGCILQISSSWYSWVMLLSFEINESF